MFWWINGFYRSIFIVIIMAFSRMFFFSNKYLITITIATASIRILIITLIVKV